MTTIYKSARRLALAVAALQLFALLIPPAAKAYAYAGTLDETFAQSGEYTNNFFSSGSGEMATDEQGNIYVATSKYVDNSIRVAVFKLNSNGAMAWPGSGVVVFEAPGNRDEIADLALDSSGRIYVVGYSMGTEQKAFILRINPSGTLDTTFGNGGRVLWKPAELLGPAFTSISIDANDRIFVTGHGGAQYESPTRGVSESFVASFNNDGSLNTSFSSDGYVFLPSSTYGDYLYDSVFDNNGDLVVSGKWLERTDLAGADNFTQFLLARLNMDGTFDSSFATGGMIKTLRGNLSGSWNNVNVDSDNNYLLTGNSYATSGPVNSNIAFDKYSDTGLNLLSNDFDTGTYDYGVYVAPGPNGGTYIGARTTSVVPRIGDIVPTSTFLRLNAAGNLDTSFITTGSTGSKFDRDLTDAAIVDGGLVGLASNGSANGWVVMKYSRFDRISPPTNINSTVTAERVDLTWDLPSDLVGNRVADYLIEMSTDNLYWTAVSDGVSTTRSATISSLTPNSTYYFRVSALTSTIPSMYLNTSALLTSMPEAPGVPSLTCSIDGMQVALAWSPSQSGGRFESGFQIQRKLGAGAWIDLASKDSSTFTHSETTNSAQSGEIAYRLRSANDGGNSEWSSACTITAPSTPSTPALTGSLSALVVSLSFPKPNENGMPIQNFTLQRKKDAGSWSNLSVLIPTANSPQTYSDTMSQSDAGKTIAYRLLATNAVGSSANSSEVSVTLPAVPLAPASIAAVPGSSDITISWNAPENADDAQPLQFLTQATSDGLTWTTFTPSSFPTVNSAVFDSASPGASYRFRIKATNSFGESAWSTSSNSTQLLPTTPTTPTTPITTPTTPTTPSGSTTVVINTPSVVINTPEVTVKTPAVTIYSANVKVGSTVAATTLARALKIKIPSKAVTTTAVAKSSAKYCKVVSGKIRGIKKGICNATVTVQGPKAKNGKKPAAIKKSIKIQVG